MTPRVTYGHFSIANQKLEMEDMISYLPILPHNQYQNFIAYKTLTQTVRLLSRILSVTLPMELLEKLKCKNYRQNSILDVKRNPKALTEFLPKETTSLLMKLAFLVLVKTSNSIYVPKRGSNVEGLFIHKTRYSHSAMNKIFKSQILPVISSKDKNLLKRIFELNHNESTNGRRMHLPLGLTMVRSKTGKYLFYG